MKVHSKSLTPPFLSRTFTSSTGISLIISPTLSSAHLLRSTLKGLHIGLFYALFSFAFLFLNSAILPLILSSSSSAFFSHVLHFTNRMGIQSCIDTYVFVLNTRFPVKDGYFIEFFSYFHNVLSPPVIIYRALFTLCTLILSFNFNSEPIVSLFAPHQKYALGIHSYLINLSSPLYTIAPMMLTFTLYLIICKYRASHLAHEILILTRLFCPPTDPKQRDKVLFRHCASCITEINNNKYVIACLQDLTNTELVTNQSINTISTEHHNDHVIAYYASYTDSNSLQSPLVRWTAQNTEIVSFFHEYFHFCHVYYCMCVSTSKYLISDSFSSNLSQHKQSGGDTTTLPQYSMSQSVVPIFIKQLYTFRDVSALYTTISSFLSNSPGSPQTTKQHK